MLHPSTELRPVNEEKGRGIFETDFIPKGTLTYVKDELEIEIPPNDPRLTNPKYRDIIETYTYIDETGYRILSWDNAKYINHCCQCNTMSTGYGFEIAIRDIDPDEEITDEYGMFNFDYEIELACTYDDCRETVTGHDVTKWYREWDKKVKEALAHLDKVDQPLLEYLDSETHRRLEEFLKTGKNYVSVLELHYRDS